MAKIIEILDEVRDIVRACADESGDGRPDSQFAIDSAQLVPERLPADVAYAGAETLFKVTVRTLIRHVAEDPALLPPFFVAITSLNEGIGQLIRDSDIVHTSSLLGHIHQAQLHERMRIARELHDHLGEGISAALRQIELHEITDSDRVPNPTVHTVLAKLTLMETMSRLRLVISDLRRNVVTSLSKEINEYITVAAPQADVRLLLNGNENWIPPVVLSEVFLIIRESLRNAFTHGAPRLVTINIDITPSRLEAHVDDDGCGFDVLDLETSDGSSLGLATMRERAALIGASLTVTSSPGRGTHVGFQVPLTARNARPELMRLLASTIS